MTRYWLIRAGEESRHARAFADSGIVAVGWPDVSGLDRLEELTRSDIVNALKADPRINTPGQDASELLAFRDDVSTGDVVVTPDSKTREVLVGEITGPYTYRDPSPAGDYKHVREVHWYARLSRDLLADDRRKELNFRRTIRELGSPDQWDSIAARARDGEGRAPVLRSARAGRGSARGPVGPLAARRTCLSCGLQKTLNQFAAGNDACVDCR